MLRKVVIFGFILPAAVLSADQFKSQDGKRSLFNYSQVQGLPSQIYYRNDIIILKDGSLLNGTLESLPALQYNFGRLPLSIETVVIFASVPDSQGKWMAQTGQGRRYVASISEKTVDFKENFTDQDGAISRKLRKIPLNKVDYILMKPRGGLEPHTPFNLTFANGDEAPVNVVDKEIPINDGKKKRVIKTMDILQITFNGGIQGTLKGSDGNQVTMGLAFVENPHISVIMSDNRGTLRLPWKNISQISKPNEFNHQNRLSTPEKREEPNQVIMAKGEIRIPEIDFLHEMKPMILAKGEIEIASVDFADFASVPEAIPADAGEIATPEINFNQPNAMFAAKDEINTPNEEERNDFDDWLKELEGSSLNEVIAFQEDINLDRMNIKDEKGDDSPSSANGNVEKDIIFITKVDQLNRSSFKTPRSDEGKTAISFVKDCDPAKIAYDTLLPRNTDQFLAAGEDFDLPDGVLDGIDPSDENKTETKRDGGEIDFITKVNGAKRHFLTKMKDEPIPTIDFILDSDIATSGNNSNQLLAADEDFALPEGIIDTLNDECQEESSGEKGSRSGIDLIPKGKVEKRRYFTSLRDEQIPTIDFIKDQDPIIIAYEKSAAEIQANQLFAASEDFELQEGVDDSLDPPVEEIKKGSEKNKESEIDFISNATKIGPDVIAMHSQKSLDALVLQSAASEENTLDTSKSNDKEKNQEVLEKEIKSSEIPIPQPAKKTEKAKVEKKSYPILKQQLKKETHVVLPVREAEINPYEGMIYVKSTKQHDTIGFYIQTNKVTNKEYKEFVDAVNYKPPTHWVRGKIPPGLEGKPVVNISYKDAFLYTVWIGKRLPTEQELLIASSNKVILSDNEDVVNEWTATPHVPSEDYLDEGAVTSARIGSAFASGHVIFGNSNPKPMKNTDYNAQTGFRLAAFAQ